jgi:hypothetical protein
MTIGVQQSRDQREKQLSYTAGTEMEQQIRVPITGKAENGWGYFDKGVGFKFPFVWLPVQRGAPFKTPQFSYGIEHTSGTTQLVIIHASVLKWNINRSSRVEGAKIRFAASAPMLPEEHSTNFSAIAHLTFQGWAAPQEGEN